MRRTGAVLWHASFAVIAAVLYFFFVLPRWFELIGETPFALGTVLRIVCGALVGLAAIPVLLTLQRTRRPEFGTPQLALTLRTVSIVLHVVAGVLIVGTAISEIWLDLDTAGRWLFGSYGAAAAIALLGFFAFYLAFVAELPPPPPKPVKPKKTRGRRGRTASGDDEAAEPNEAETTAADESDESGPAGEADESGPVGEADATNPGADASTSDEASDTPAKTGRGLLRNRRSR
ncbi:hypothetical protein [uncultured Mycolicibacterium sp.]|uniref:hypothetical protein n=1 Tax=uncultured Mycolicibacterium sp. TaxID=2320817 RepID=UPI002629BA36|nr:hypothetical protein [uncultured Mycolicibacterium sp.]